jgi:hypothetical protein
MRTFAAITLSVALISSADAQTSESANYKLPACRDFNAAADNNLDVSRALVQDANRLFRAASCGGEVDGVANTLEDTGQICQPRGVTRGQVMAVVMSYVERIPERHNESFTVLAIEALKRAWPCR